MSKPFKSWVRLAIVVSLSIFTPFNSAFAGRWMERWMHRPNCKSVPVCEVETAAVSIDACSTCGEVGISQTSSSPCCACVPDAPAVAPDKSVPWTGIEPATPVEPATPAEEPSNAKPDAKPAVDPKMKSEAAAAPSAPVAPVPIIPSDASKGDDSKGDDSKGEDGKGEDGKGEDEPEADETKPREVDEKPASSEPEPMADDGDPDPAPSETEVVEPAVADQPEMEEPEGKDSDAKDLVEPEPSLDDLFGAPKAAAPDSKKPSAKALKDSDTEDAAKNTEEPAKKIEESIDDLFGKPVNFGPSTDRVSPPAPRPSDAGNASNSSTVKPTGESGKPTGVTGKPAGVSTPESKVRNEGAEKNGGQFRLNEEEPKKGKGAGIEDELDRIFRSKTFVPPTKFQGAEFRNWTDNTGAYSIQARVAVIFGDKVRLLKENGKYTTVPMERLSDFDRSYVQWVAESLTYRASKIVRNNNADEISPEMAR